MKAMIFLCAFIVLIAIGVLIAVIVAANRKSGGGDDQDAHRRH